MENGYRTDPGDGADAAAEDSGRRTLPETAGQTSPDNPWPLHHFASILKNHIERAPETWIEGQLLEANVRNGHAYLTMRDVDVENSLSVTVWRSTMDRLETKPQVGARVVARIKPNLYLKTGRLSMNASDLRPVGLGDLLARLERLRQALGAEGLFDPGRKRPLPLLPQRIGLITGRDSDAEKDVIRNATLRWPGVEFEVRNTAVQGVNAVGEVMAALAELDGLPEVDVIVIARGGGALEDLLPFSSEELVRAVSAASTPVVSAIGHEADRPILDDVADVRASTPTDAAKRIVPDVAEERAGIAEARLRLDRAVYHLVEREGQRLEALRTRPVLADPEAMIESRAEDLARASDRNRAAARQAVDRAETDLRHLRAQVRQLSPQHTLDRGYAVVQIDPRGAAPAGVEPGDIVRDATTVPDGAGLLVRVAVGSLDATVTATHPSNT
ncbi:exodeoxyribonuclease VII large subunit [Zhihengliuella alba]|uniref:Exodeoxyribonuclease 7 large subunit n=1 Tax=Zhihengliuella alba TaxID=547018 RepID=A0ABP7D013_9MICC